MSKYPTAWRAHRTLAKCAAFKRGAVAVECIELGKAIGVLVDPVDEPLLSVFDDGVVLHTDRAIIRYDQITGITARERRAEYVTGLVIQASGRTHTVEITTMTGRFKDIFEVFRFLLRCEEDRQQPEAEWVVVVKDGAITVTDPKGRHTRIAIDQLARVDVETNDQGPWFADVWWLLFNAGGEVACGFPQGATGEKAALDLLFALPRFDHDAFGKAMSSNSIASFEVWRAA